MILFSPSVFAAKDKVVLATHLRFDDVIQKARLIAQKPYVDPGQDLPESLKAIGYDQWRDIRFRSEKSLWPEGPFKVQFFHPGFLYKEPVIIHEVARGEDRRVPFSPDLFDYADKTLKDGVTGDHGFAGFRIHYPINTPKYADEVVAFLGASYFRALGRDHAYGLSARGLAVDTAEDTGEEFPLFREFWVIRPLPGAKEVTVYALLDSKSLAGAYEFIIRPGAETVMKVRSFLFVRIPVRKLGIAPATSMFFYGENSGSHGDSDFRPEVHDSDGLLIKAASGEWIWHPLVNEAKLIINSFSVGQPYGFGLIQRDTVFDHYQDLEARYEKRPSLWVTPEGDWGKGRIELIQLPTPSEYNDNIVAYWVPEKAMAAGDVIKFAYTLAWHSARDRQPPMGCVQATRVVRKDNEVTFVIDFSGDKLQALPVDRYLTPDIGVFNNGKVMASQIMKNTVTGGWRLVIRVKLDKAGFLKEMMPSQLPAAELRAFLKDGNDPVTETWSYTYQP